MNARTGKIARLPHDIREQINERLLDGHSALSILPWLNDLPEVQAILQAEFDSKPINAVNLTAWRAGGFRDWFLRQQAVELIQNLDDDEHGPAQSLARPLSGKLAVGSLCISLLWPTPSFPPRKIRTSNGPVSASCAPISAVCVTATTRPSDSPS